jgi:hypothetical protein
MRLNLKGLLSKVVSERQRNDQQVTEPASAEDSRPSRILFAGFSKVRGFNAFDWTDWEWPNAADHDVLFINCGSLFNMLSEWKQRDEANTKDTSLEPIVRLGNNLDSLRDQVLQVINSDRTIFALAAPQEWFQFRTQTGGRPTLAYTSLSAYSWCSLPVKTHLETGEVIKEVDRRFGEYRKHIKTWHFYFEKDFQILEHLNVGLPSKEQVLVLESETLFENLSRQPLGMELRYRAYKVYQINEYGEAVRLRKPEQTERVSGPIYLLHYPVGGDVFLALSSLLRTFCGTDFPKSEVPNWIDTILSPRGKEFDQEIERLSVQLEEISRQVTQLTTERGQLERWRRLLYESGEPLEEVVLEALKLLGLENVRRGRKGDHDIAGELHGETILFEVKGLNGSVGRREVFDLDRHMDEFRAQNPGNKLVKGILAANAYRGLSPADRDTEGRQVFAGDAIKHAQLLNLALLDTRDLYRVLTLVIECSRPTAGMDLLRSLRNCIGLMRNT